MGNASSNKSGPASPNRMETASAAAGFGGSGSSSSPDTRSPGDAKRQLAADASAVDDHKRTFNKKMICNALQAQGMGIAESELNRALVVNGGSYLDTLTYIMEENLARKTVKAHPPGPISRRRITSSSSSSAAAAAAAGDNRSQENVRPPLLPSPAGGGGGGATMSNKRKMITQKRPPLEAERPAKRPVVMTAAPAFSFLGGGAAAPKPSGNLFAEAMRRQPVAAASAAATRFFERDEAGAESTDSEERPGTSAMRVDKSRPLMALKQGSPQRQQQRPTLALSMVPRKQQQQQQRSERSSSPTAMSDTPVRRGFAIAPERFSLGKMGASMVKGVDRWAERTREQQDEAVRLILNDLRLSPLGLGRREKFESQLSDRIYMAMESLSQGFNAQDGAITISRKVLELRLTIHEVTTSLGGKYEELYGKAVAADDAGSGNTTTNNSRRSSSSGNNNNNNNRSNNRSNNNSSSTSIVASPRIAGRDNYYNGNSSNNNNRSNNNNSSSSIFAGSGGGGGSRWGIRAFGKGGRFGPGKEEGELAACSSPFGSFLGPPVSPAGSSVSKRSASNQSTASARQQQQQQQQRESAIDRPPSFSIGGMGLGGGGGGTSFWGDTGRTATRKDLPNALSSSPVQPQRGVGAPSSANNGSGGGTHPIACEETSFWAALDVCKGALGRVSFCRREEQWLEVQREAVQERIDETEEDDQMALAEHQTKVETTKDEVQTAADAVEDATNAVIGDHLNSDGSKEDALRSLVSSLQQSQGQLGGCDPLAARQRAMGVKDATEAKLKKQETQLVVVEHATKICAVLCNEMYGDLMDVIDEVQEEARQRKFNRQELLKSTAKELLDKLGGALTFHAQRKSSAQENMASTAGQIAHGRKFFGPNASSTIQAEANYTEMQDFARDSSNKILAIIDQTRTLQEKMEVALSQEDLDDLMQESKRILQGREGLTNPNDGKIMPDTLRKALLDARVEVSSKGQCRLM